METWWETTGFWGFSFSSNFLKTTFCLQEEEEEEDVVDPAFMDWAKHWAENPTVQSAVLERKLKAKHRESSCEMRPWFISKRGYWSNWSPKEPKEWVQWWDEPSIFWVPSFFAHLCILPAGVARWGLIRKMQSTPTYSGYILVISATWHHPTVAGQVARALGFGGRSTLVQGSGYNHKDDTVWPKQVCGCVLPTGYRLVPAGKKRKRERTFRFSPFLPRMFVKFSIFIVLTADVVNFSIFTVFLLRMLVNFRFYHFLPGMLVEFSNFTVFIADVGRIFDVYFFSLPRMFVKESIFTVPSAHFWPCLPRMLVVLFHMYTYIYI